MFRDRTSWTVTGRRKPRRQRRGGRAVSEEQQQPDLSRYHSARLRARAEQRYAEQQQQRGQPQPQFVSGRRYKTRRSAFIYSSSSEEGEEDANDGDAEDSRQSGVQR